MFTIVRILWSLWILGFIVLAVVATSRLIFAPTGTPARLHTWLLRMFMAAVWPLAPVLTCRARRAEQWFPAHQRRLSR